MTGAQISYLFSIIRAKFYLVWSYISLVITEIWFEYSFFWYGYTLH